MKLKWLISLAAAGFAAALTVVAPALEAQNLPDIGVSWPDRRPIGQLILADNSKIYYNSPSDQNLNGWLNGGPYALGTSAFQSDILSRVQATINNTIACHGQGILIWDITGCGKTNGTANPPKLNEQYLGDPRFLDPSGSGLTTQTSYGPYVPPGSPMLPGGLEPAMNAIADTVFYNIRSANLVPGVCIRAQKAYVDAVGDLDGTYGPSQYDTCANQLDDLDAKLAYAYNRWGCRLFYVDSNQAAADALSAQQSQGNPTWAPAWVYTQLRARHPDCLIFPEEAYLGACSIPAIGVNDPAYQYDRVAARYSELSKSAPSRGLGSPFLSNAELAAVPSAFTLINLKDPSTWASNQDAKIQTALRNNQCILLIANAWFNSAEVSKCLQLQKTAHVNGF
jgi:hypothetical protein